MRKGVAMLYSLPVEKRKEMMFTAISILEASEHKTIDKVELEKKITQQHNAEPYTALMLIERLLEVRAFRQINLENKTLIELTSKAHEVSSYAF